MKKLDKATQRLWSKPASSAAGFLDTVLALRDSLIESHMEEYETKHAGDATHKGPAPEACSYCQTIQDYDEIYQAGVKYAPAPKTIEGRGRNGYFMLASASAWTMRNKQDQPIVVLDIGSKAGFRNVGPIMLQGKHDDIEQLLLHLLIEVQREKAALT